MPGGDGYGSLGKGPMTGRRAGYCNRYNRPGWMNSENIGLYGFFGMGLRRFRNRWKI